MKTKNNYAIFIISHGRAENLLTMLALEKSNVKSNVYIIIDNLDAQKEKYFELYEDKVIVFDKEKMLKKTDTMDNFHNLSSAVYARNFCFELAKKLKVDYFICLDDDIKYFCNRYDNQGSLSRSEIKDIDDVFNIYIDYMQKANITCIGFGNEGGYIGGVFGKFAKGFGRTANQAMIIKTNSDIKYLGTQNEDFNICCRYFEKIFMEIYKISIFTPKRGTNEGGNDYGLSNEYCSNFYSVMLAPSCNKIKLGKNSAILKRKWNMLLPEIVSEVYKK